MAESNQHPPEIAAALVRSEAARARLSADIAAVRQKLNAPARVARSLCSHPLKWVGGAVATGLGATLLFRRSPKHREPVAPKPKKPLPATLLMLAFSAAKPALRAWLTGRITHLLSQRQAQSQPRPRTAHTPI